MNSVRWQIVDQIKKSFLSEKRIRFVNEKAENFDEKLFSLIRVEAIREKDAAPKFGRFFVPLSVCRSAGLIDGDFDPKPQKNSEDQFFVESTREQFFPRIFDDLIGTFREKNFYGRPKTEIYFDQWKKKPKWTKIEEKKEKVMVEFSSPNIGKPLHAGHLRSTLLGEFISKIHQKFGHRVSRVNYLGDWGTQYGRLAVGFSRFGSQEELKQNPLKHLLDVYVKANQDESLHDEAMKYFAKMESADVAALDLWRIFRQTSIENLKQIYRLFNIEFDEYQSESEFSVAAKEILRQLETFSLCEKRSDGVREVKIPPNSTDFPREIRFVVEKSDGTTLYISRDIAALKFRLENFDVDRIFYVVDSSQTEHFRNLLATSKALKFEKTLNWDLEDFHIPFGRMINFQTRKGKFDLLSDVLEDARERAKEGLNRFLIRKQGVDHDNVEKTIGKAYLILTDFSRPRRTDYTFSWHEISSKDGIAFLLLYCHARLSSLEKQVGMPIDWSADFRLLKDPRELILIQHLSTFQDVLFDAYRSHEPNKIVKYLIHLAKCTNRALATLYVKDEEAQLAKARLVLYHMCRVSLKEGLDLLGIEALDRI